jgi:resuscitation-promoting factor RpfB
MSSPDAGREPARDGRSRPGRVRPLAWAVALCVGLVLAGVGGVAHAATSQRHVMRGVSLVAVQHKLRITADGVWGPQTKRAVMRFQRRHGLEVDGVVGPNTARALGLRIRASGASRRSLRARLEAIARCESGGDPTAVSSGGTYRGKYQFDRATWRALGGRGDPAAAPESEQDRRAARLMRTSGPGAWPNCA